MIIIRTYNFLLRLCLKSACLLQKYIENTRLVLNIAQVYHALSNVLNNDSNEYVLTYK